MTTLGRFTFTSLSLYALMVTLGCSSTVPEVERVHFKETVQASEFEKQPFHRAWYDRNVDWEDIKGIYVTSVNYASLKEQTWWNDVSLEKNREVAIKEVSQHMQHAIKKAFADDPTHKLPVVDKPGPEIVVIDLTLVELVPTKVWFHTSASISGQSVELGSVAMKARVREGETGRVIALFADRHVGKQGLMNMTDPAWSFHIHNIMDNWAHQIVTILPFTKEEKEQPFINHYVKSIGAAFADMFSKLGAAPRLGLRSP